MTKAIIVSILVLCSCAPCLAQQKQPLWKPDWSFCAYWLGGSVDTFTSLNKREAGLFRDKQGIFAPKPNLAFKGGLSLGFQLLKMKYREPQQRRWIQITEGAIGAVWVGIGFFHNRHIKAVK